MGNSSSSSSKNTSGGLERRNTKKDKEKNSKQKPSPPTTAVVKPYNDLEYREEPQEKGGWYTCIIYITCHVVELLHLDWENIN